MYPCSNRIAEAETYTIFLGSPLLTPWWAAANVISGLAIVMWIVAPILCQLFTELAETAPNIC